MPFPPLPRLLPWAFVLSLSASAQTVLDWRAEATNGNFNDSTHWWNGVSAQAPTGAEILRFQNNNQLIMNNDLSGAAADRYQILFLAGASSSRTIGGSTQNTFHDFETLRPKIENQSAVLHSLNFPILIGPSFDLEVNPVNGNLTLGGALNNNGRNLQVYGDNGHTLTLAGAISGAGGLWVQENSTVFTTNNGNTFSGGVTITEGVFKTSVNNGAGTGGTITLGTASTGSSPVSFLVENSADIARPITVAATGSGPVIIGTNGAGVGGNATTLSGTMTLNRATTLRSTVTDRLAIEGQVSGNVGTLTVDGGFRTTFSNTSNNFVGDLVLSGAGTILQASVVTAGEVIPNGTSLTVGAGTILKLAASGGQTETINGLNGSGTVQRHESVGGLNTLVLGSANGGGTFSGSFNNGGGQLAITKSGSGTQTFSGPSTYSGTTRVTGGTLISGNATAFGTGFLQVDTGGTANLAGFSMANALVMNGGTVNLANAATGAITLNNVAGNTFAPNGNYRVLSGVIGGPGGFTVANGGGVPGLTLSNAGNNFAGNVTLNANTYLRLENSEVLPDTATVIFNGAGNLRLEPNNGTETLAGLSGTGGSVWRPTTSSGTFNLRVGSGNVSSVFAGTVGAASQNNNLALTKIGTGTLTLNGAGFHTTGSVVSGGSLILGTNTAAGSGPITVGDSASGAGALALLAQGAGLSFGNGITVANEGGTVTLGSTGASSGNIQFNGTLTLNKPVVLTAASADRTTWAGVIQGSPGTITVQGGQRTVFSNPANSFTGDIVVTGANTILQTGVGSGTEHLPDGSSVTVGAGAFLKLAGVSGSQETLAGLSGTGQVRRHESVSGTQTLRLGFNDVIASFGGSFVAAGGGPLAIRKIGTGTQTFTSGGNTATGGVTVEAGVLAFNAPSLGFDSGVFGASTPLLVNPGGTLRVTGDWNISSANAVTVNGGTLEFNGGLQGVNYVNNLNLQNGGQVSGTYFRTGNNFSPTFTVSGDTPAEISANLYLVDNVNLTGIRRLNLDVADGAAAQDLLVSGVIYDLGQNGTTPDRRGMDVRKIGPGTVSFTASNQFQGDLILEQGKVEVANGNELALGNPFLYNPQSLHFNGGTLRVTGSDLTLNDPNRGLFVNVGGGTFEVTAGRNLTLVNPLQAGNVNVFKDGAGRLHLPGTHAVGTLNLNAGEVDLTGGTLRVDALQLNGGVFNWANGRLTILSNSGNAGVDDFSQTGYAPVYEGHQLEVAGDLATASGSVLQMHASPTFYLNNGVRFNRLNIDGDLNLSVAGDVLEVEISPYLLRPFSPSYGPSTNEYASIPLVTVSGLLTGTFDTFAGVLDDGRGFEEYTGVFTSAGALPVNSWYLEYRTAGPGAGIYFHYRVAGYVPEPGTLSLLAAGLAGLRLARRVRRRAAAAVEHLPERGSPCSAD
jgi:autotransporter-associated beta strand protein